MKCAPAYKFPFFHLLMMSSDLSLLKGIISEMFRLVIKKAGALRLPFDWHNLP